MLNLKPNELKTAIPILSMISKIDLSFTFNILRWFSNRRDGGQKDEKSEESFSGDCCFNN